MLKIELELYQSADDYAAKPRAELGAAADARPPRRADAITLRLSPSRNGGAGRSGSR